MQKTELHLQVQPLDGVESYVSVVQILQSLGAGDVDTRDKGALAARVCHKMIKSRWLVFNLTRVLLSEVSELNQNLQLIISTTPPLKVAATGKRQPFLTLVTENVGPPRSKDRFASLKMGPYSSQHVSAFLGDGSLKKTNQRSKRSGLDICRKRRHAVRFRDLKWNGWIIAPTRFGFHYCEGICSATLSQEYNPSNHAILQNILHHRLTSEIPAATCVPIELHSMSLLYYDTDNTIVLREVPEMVASNCGCR